jgi:hypothetical protein
VSAPGHRFRAFACALPAVEERDHLGVPSFRVADKIFAQLSADGEVGLVKMPHADQAACLRRSPERYSVPEHWGRFGWTYVRIDGTDDAQLRKLIERSWSLVAPKKLIRSKSTLA